MDGEQIELKEIQTGGEEQTRDDDKGQDNPAYRDDEGGATRGTGNIEMKDFDPWGGKARSKIPEYEHETSFINQKEIEQKLEQGFKNLENQDEAWGEINRKFPNADKLNVPFKSYIDEDGRVMVELKRGGAKPYNFLDRNGDANKALPKTILKSLGSTAEGVINENEEENNRDQTRVEQLRERRREENNRVEQLEEQTRRTDISEEDRETITNQINEIDERETNLQNQINEINERMGERNNENEIIRERMGLRNRIKEIFKKHGVTVLSIATAVGITVGVSVSNLSAAGKAVTKAVTKAVAKVAKDTGKRIEKVAKDVGKGLKDLGKKVAGLIPGMIGTIAKFIFNTASEAVVEAGGFIAKNAWLLILFVVGYVINRLSSR